jgi:hypothetical protein
MQRDPEEPVRARSLVLASAAASSLTVWLAVVKGIGYSMSAGSLYSLGYFAAMIIFFESFGYSISGEGHE